MPPMNRSTSAGRINRRSQESTHDNPAALMNEEFGDDEERQRDEKSRLRLQVSQEGHDGRWSAAAGRGNERQDEKKGHPGQQHDHDDAPGRSVRARRRRGASGGQLIERSPEDAAKSRHVGKVPEAFICAAPSSDNEP